jgi:hypothetical protein
VSGPRCRTGCCKGNMATFDWHAATIARATQLAASDRNTQNVRNSFQAECCHHFRFGRSFVALLKASAIGGPADEYPRRASPATGTR